MNDRHRYRGKRVDTGEWVIGSLVEFEDCPQIVYGRTNGLNNAGVTVAEDTIGQCTGIKDKAGRLVFEGDVLKRSTGTVGVVKWREEYACFDFWYIDDYSGNYSVLLSHIITDSEIVGDIYTNPELVEGAEE